MSGFPDRAADDIAMSYAGCGQGEAGEWHGLTACRPLPHLSQSAIDSSGTPKAYRGAVFGLRYAALAGRSLSRANHPTRRSPPASWMMAIAGWGRRLWVEMAYQL